MEKIIIKYKKQLRGFLITSIYYVVALISVLISVYFLDTGYPHFFNTYHFVGAFFLLGGFVRIGQLLSSDNEEKGNIAIVSHIFYLLVIISYLLFSDIKIL